MTKRCKIVMKASQQYLKVLAVLISVIALPGCFGNMGGIIRNQGGKVAVSQTGGMYSIALPDGETFKGKQVQVQTSHLSGVLIEPPTVRSPFADVTYYYHFGPYQRALTHGGILSGDRGHKMWCNIYATGFGGGKGLCDISDGRTVDLQW